jgi:hypothetical protein
MSVLDRPRPAHQGVLTKGRNLDLIDELSEIEALSEKNTEPIAKEFKAFFEARYILE